MLNYGLLFARNLFSRRAVHLIRRRYICLMFTLVFVVVTYVQINKTVQGTYTWKNNGRKCRNSQTENEQLLYLIRNTHQILDSLKIDHFLSYGSLWGALRFQQPLPWDYDFDIGIVYEDLENIDVKELKAKFAEKGIRIFYQYYAGNYKVEYGEMSGDLMIFRDYYNNGFMTRIGIESWLLFVHYRYYHQFPSRLIKKPLPKLYFADLEFSAPREGIELQKYLYPKNWWKTVHPSGCNYNLTNNQPNGKSKRSVTNAPLPTNITTSKS